MTEEKAPGLEQLKAHAYDCVVNIEMLQAELRRTNEAINNKLKETLQNGSPTTEEETKE